MQSANSLASLLQDVIPIARTAGDVIMRIYESDFSVSTKSDASPVTAADQAAEAVITEALTKLAPGIPIVAEEAHSAGTRWDLDGRFWLVDPLDGTKEFISRNGEFTVNIALVDGGKPVLGVVFAPAIGLLFAGTVGNGSFIEEGGVRREIACRAQPDEGLTVVSSRSHGDEAALANFLAGRKVARSTSAGSSLKLCKVAAGEADCYPRLGRTMEWDIAAGHAIVSAAGGSVTELNGSELTYGKPGLDHPHFVAWGRRP